MLDACYRRQCEQKWSVNFATVTSLYRLFAPEENILAMMRYQNYINVKIFTYNAKGFNCDDHRWSQVEQVLWTRNMDIRTHNSNSRCDITTKSRKFLQKSIPTVRLKSQCTWSTSIWCCFSTLSGACIRNCWTCCSIGPGRWRSWRSCWPSVGFCSYRRYWPFPACTMMGEYRGLRIRNLLS